MEKQTKLILVHGLGQNAESWFEMADLLRTDRKTDGMKLEIETLSLPHMLALKRANFSDLYCAFERSLFRNRHKESSLVLIGHSVGAVLTLGFFLDHPESVSKMILIAPQFRMPKHLLKLQNLIFRFLPASAFPSSGFSREDFISLCASMADLDFTEDLKTAACSRQNPVPVLILCGSKDKANLKAADELHHLIPGSSFRILPGSHELNSENPAETAKAILQFLGETD